MGSSGDWPGAMWTVHQMSVAEQGNLHVAEAAGHERRSLGPGKTRKRIPGSATGSARSGNDSGFMTGCQVYLSFWADRADTFLEGQLGSFTYCKGSSLAIFP